LSIVGMPAGERVAVLPGANANRFAGRTGRLAINVHIHGHNRTHLRLRIGRWQRAARVVGDPSSQNPPVAAKRSRLRAVKPNKFLRIRCSRIGCNRILNRSRVNDENNRRNDFHRKLSPVFKKISFVIFLNARRQFCNRANSYLAA
jgi:hypothetical protein